MMSDKSQLEKAIERQELVKKSRGVFAMIIILSFSLGALGIYTLNLRQELLIKEKEIVLIKKSFDREKALLLDKIKILEKKQGGPDFDFEPVTGSTNT